MPNPARLSFKYFAATILNQCVQGAVFKSPINKTGIPSFNGVINEKDASAGFIASIDGTKLTQVTPNNTQMRWWHYDSDSQRLFVEIVHDVNKDKKFNWDDPQTVVSVNLLDLKIGQEFVPVEVKNKIESVLLKK